MGLTKGYYWCDVTDTRHKHAKKAIRAGKNSGKFWEVSFYKVGSDKPFFVAKGPPVGDPKPTYPVEKPHVNRRTRLQQQALKVSPKGGKRSRPTKAKGRRSKQLSGDGRTTLESLGFASYENYLASRLWSGIRKRVMQRDEGCCQICRNRASQVHHRSYHVTVMQGENIDPLISLCRICHQDIEFNNDRSKRTLNEANTALDKALKMARERKRREKQKDTALAWNPNQSLQSNKAVSHNRLILIQ